MARAILACLLAVAASAAAVQAAAARPTLRLVQKAPLTLRGSGFHAGERIRLTFAFDGPKHTRSTRASRTGVFTVELPTVVVFDPCNTSLVATAVGTGGDTATLKYPQRACPPAP
jgi:hypothetical protein